MKTSSLLAALALAGTALLSTVSLASASQAVTLSHLSLLAMPDAKADIVGDLDKGLKVGVLWCNTNAGFCLVQFHKKQGFVLTSEIETIGPQPGDDVGFGQHKQPEHHSPYPHPIRM